MKTKLLKKLRHKYFDLYFIKYSDEEERWKLYMRNQGCFGIYYQLFVSSAKELLDVQNNLRKRVRSHIIKYLREKGRDPLHPNKYLW